MNQNCINWVSVSEVYDPEEAFLIIGLLEAAGVPVKVDRESAGELFGLTVGPLARINILVPNEQKLDAERLLEGDFSQDQDSDHRLR